MYCFVFKEMCIAGEEPRTWCHVPSFLAGGERGKETEIGAVRFSVLLVIV